MSKAFKKKVLKMHHTIKELGHKVQKINEPFLMLAEPQNLLSLQYTNLKTDSDE